MVYQVMPDLTTEEYGELKADIQARGVMVPIEFDEDGNVLDGHHRLQACKELGIIEYPSIIREGLTEEEKRTHARKLNMARRHLTQEQKRELIRQQLKETPEKSDRQIAAGLGVGHATVSRHRESLESSGELSHWDSSIGADGKERPRTTQREYTEAQQQEEPAGCAFFDTREDEEESSPKPHVSYNSGNNEWYTPKEYIDAARDVMGSIDLDPASNPTANETVKAEMYFTAEQDGLLQEWFGNVWLNPPYSSDLIGKFAEKVTTEDLEQAIVLVNNATETAWFEKIVSVSSAIVFPTSRVKFYRPDGTIGAPLQGQAVLYIGANAERFLQVFSRFGWGVKHEVHGRKQGNDSV